MNKPTVYRHLASLLVLAVLIGLAVGSSDSSSSKRAGPGSSAPSRSAPTGEKRISGDNWFGCIDREYRDKLGTYAVQKDMEAFRQGLAAGLAAGVCTMFTNGETVYIADTAIFSGLVKVRRRGETAEYWTNLKAVD